MNDKVPLNSLYARVTLFINRVRLTSQKSVDVIPVIVLFSIYLMGAKLYIDCCEEQLNKLVNDIFEQNTKSEVKYINIVTAIQVIIHVTKQMFSHDEATSYGEF